MEVLFGLLLGGLLIAGYVLGIVGFFRAGAAKAEVRALRLTLAQLQPWEQSTGEMPREVPREARESPRPPEILAPWTQRERDAGLGPPEAVPETVESVPPAAAEPPPEPPPRPDLESLFALRWGVWIGSVALLMSGVFLIRYAVEEGWLGPGPRCVLAALLGLALLGLAEWLSRRDAPMLAGPLRTDQAPAGLAAGGTAVLFGAAYGAGPFYDLLPPSLAFVALAAASFVGLGAALRHGQLTAAVGIGGAFATPALVGTNDPSLPGLFAYLLVVTAAALAVVRYTAWIWLGWATTVAGGVWVCLAAFQGGLNGGTDIWAAALFVPAAAALNLALLPSAALEHPMGRRLAWVPFAALGAAGLFLESLVPGAIPKAALFLLSPLAVWKGAAEPRLDRLPWVAALLGLLTLLFWALPAWNPTGEAIIVEGRLEALLPGAWAPEVIQPLIQAAALLAAFHAAAGLWFERRAPRPLPWSSLTAAVPVLTLIVAYAQIARFQTGAVWAAVALALAAALTAAAARAAADHAPQRAGVQRAGVHAAGAVAALALGCAMLLREQWLTFAVALFLPALAWIEARADLPPLRHVALAVAAIVLVRLLGNWYVLDYAFGTVPLANGLIPAYAAPAAAFALAAVLFRRRADDALVTVLEAGAVAFAGVFAALEIRHWFGGGHLDGARPNEAEHFREIVLHLLTIAAQATVYLHLAQRTGRATLDWAWRIMGGIALAGSALLLALNPCLTGSPAGPATLLMAYPLPALLALIARRRLTEPLPRRLLGAYAMLAGFVWITCQIRQSFHPDDPSLFLAPIEDAELWAWSGAWLLYGAALLAAGLRGRDQPARLAGLGVIGLVCAKAFLIDMAGLTGLWRVVSFLGLGLSLMALAAAYRRFVPPTQAAGGAVLETKTPPPVS